MSILVDTGVFCGFLNKGDENTEEAEAILAACMDGVHGAVLTTSDVVDETFTLLLARGSPLAHAEQFRTLVGWGTDEPPLASVLEIDQTRRRRAWDAFERHYEEKGLSFTDCTSLVTMRERGIDKIASFDDGFDGLVERVDGSQGA